VLTWVVGIQVFSAGRVTAHRIWGAVAIYLQLSMLFALSYLLIESQHPDAFYPVLTFHGPMGDILQGAHGGAQLIYFSLSTLTTTGYGDIVPVHPVARSLANLEALIGQLFPATLLARLVTLELAERRQ
jgi:voltage-gated potassium channel Kch